ncbi:hypothetical membrane protein, DUF1212 family [Lactiplantibacillus plantarum]|nr:hypothetical membrane protein, DUF1212 family [Lactiplantibacillus plantarum]
MNNNQKSPVPLSQRHHMTIPWKDFIRNEDAPAKHASIQERTSIVGRVGILMLSCGTGPGGYAMR